MALGRPSKRRRRGESAGAGAKDATGSDPLTNVVIADIVLRGAGILLRQRLEKGLIAGQVPRERVRRLVEERSILTTAALYGASRLATRSPLGLALVAGGLAAKVLYDRGKRIEAERRARRLSAPGDPGTGT